MEIPRHLNSQLVWDLYLCVMNMQEHTQGGREWALDSRFRQPLGWSQYNKLLFSFVSCSAVVQPASNFYGSSKHHVSMSTGCRWQAHEIIDCSYLKLVNSVFLFTYTGGSLSFFSPSWRPHQVHPWSPVMGSKHIAALLSSVTCFNKDIPALAVASCSLPLRDACQEHNFWA